MWVKILESVADLKSEDFLLPKFFGVFGLCHFFFLFYFFESRRGGIRLNL